MWKSGSLRNTQNKGPHFKIPLSTSCSFPFPRLIYLETVNQSVLLNTQMMLTEIFPLSKILEFFFVGFSEDRSPSPPLSYL